MSSPASHQGVPTLPPGITPIVDVLDEKVQKGALVNIIGVVKDCRLPIATRGEDYKSTMVIFDLSTEDSGTDLTIFRSKKEEFPVVSAADVVSLRNVKVQNYGGTRFSLITNHSTSISVYSAARIPRPPNSAEIALLPPARKKAYKEPNHVENSYVSYMFHTISKDAVPGEAEFANKTTISLNVKQKFGLLQDVEEGKFYDFVVRVTREPYDPGACVTLYVSDYTENNNFFDYTPEDVQDLDTGDVWGYTSEKQDKDEPQNEEGWVGPSGKKAMQITVYEPHAAAAKSLHAGDWISIKNVHIKHSSNGMYLEGAVREARNQAVSTNDIIILRRDCTDPNYIAAVERAKLERRAKGKKKRESEPAEATNPSKKPALNSKQRRKLKRQQEEKDAAGKEAQEAQAQTKAQTEAQAQAKQRGGADLQGVPLNSSIVSEHPDKPVTPLSAMIDHQPFEVEATVKGDKTKKTTITVPFVNNKYRAHVRVVDFEPNHLEDFAASRGATRRDDSSDDDSDSTMTSPDRGGRKVWEWRFRLCLEEATPSKSGPKTRLWVSVDNMAGQCLTGLDASDLHRDKNNLTALREKMFYLWGELEEHKGGMLALRKSLMQQRAPPPTLSDGEDNGDKEANISNIPFTCCIKQWGVQVKENGQKEWEKVFGLFGTKIAT